MTISVLSKEKYIFVFKKNVGCCFICHDSGLSLINDANSGDR